LALLETTRLPATFPGAAGIKFTETVSDWLGVRTTFEPALVLKLLPDVETFEINKLAVPVLVRLMSCAVEFPTVTLPKFRLESLTESIASS